MQQTMYVSGEHTHINLYIHMLVLLGVRDITSPIDIFSCLAIESTQEKSS